MFSDIKILAYRKKDAANYKKNDSINTHIVIINLELKIYCRKTSQFD